MGRHRQKSQSSPRNSSGLSINPAIWANVIASLNLSPQQAKIVALILRGYCDKEIAAELGLRVPTVRTHLGRLFQRLQVEDRIGLVLRVFAIVQTAWEVHACHQN